MTTAPGSEHKKGSAKKHEFLGILALVQTFIVGLLLGDQGLTEVYTPIGISLAMNCTRLCCFYLMFTSVIDSLWMVYLDVRFDKVPKVFIPIAFFAVGIACFFAHSILSLYSIHFLYSVEVGLTDPLPYKNRLYAAAATPQLLFILVIIPALTIHQYRQARAEALAGLAAAPAPAPAPAPPRAAVHSMVPRRSTSSSREHGLRL